MTDQEQEIVREVERRIEEVIISERP